MDHEKIRNTLCQVIYNNDSFRPLYVEVGEPQLGEVISLSI